MALKLPILLGASKETLESPLIPLPAGKFKFLIYGLSDTVFQVVFENGMRMNFDDRTEIDGDRSLKLQRMSKGTEAVFIDIYLERIEPDGTQSNSA